MRASWKIALRRVATMALLAAVVGLAVGVVLIEALLLSFAPDPFTILLLPVLVAIAAVVAWQLIATLYRWAPRITQ